MHVNTIRGVTGMVEWSYCVIVVGLMMELDALSLSLDHSSWELSFVSSTDIVRTSVKRHNEHQFS